MIEKIKITNTTPDSRYDLSKINRINSDTPTIQPISNVGPLNKAGLGNTYPSVASAHGKRVIIAAADKNPNCRTCGNDLIKAARTPPIVKYAKGRRALA